MLIFKGKKNKAHKYENNNMNLFIIQLKPEIELCCTEKIKPAANFNLEIHSHLKTFIKSFLIINWSKCHALVM